MKTRFTGLLIFLFSATFSFGQDTILKKNGDEIKAKILLVNSSEIKYSLPDEKRDSLQPANEYLVPKGDVFMIKYANGAKEVFDEAKTETVAREVPFKLRGQSEAELYQQGRVDALTHYDGYKGAGTGVLLVSLLSPAVGLIPAIACSSTTPKDHNLSYPSQERFDAVAYKNGYRRQARKIKSGKVWKNWGIALGVNVVLVLFTAN